jgi:EAL domain-containing protein (putative c-di-GMP-specific phosphodiesterase class I)
VAASRLDVELTETALFDISSSRIAELDALRELGVSVYVDDFGVGFSSISHLRDLPVSGLKLDRSFTSGVEESGSKSHRLSIGLSGLATALGLSAVAEGVETAEQARVLAEQGWPKAQGYYFGRPSPVPETSAIKR